MCKKLIFLVLCAALPFSGAAMAEVDDSGRLIVPETSTAPVIDGELDDVWQNVSEEILLITDIINATNTVPDDASDLSGTFKVMYDVDNFYFFIEVQDSVLDYEFSNHNGDSVEIFFDGDNSKGSTYDGVNDNQIRINIDDVELDDIGKSLPVDGTDFKVLPTDLGYNVEAAFPLTALQIVPENVFGFEVQLNDNDGGGGRETLIRWFSNDNNSWRDASLFGEAMLVPAPEPEPVDPGSDGLVAHWPLNEGAGDTAADIVGGNDGTLKGGVAWAGEGSPVNGDALSFDGYSDGVHHATDPGTINWVSVEPFDVVGPGITLAAWIRPDGFDIGDARIITKQKSWSSIDIWWMLSTYTDGTALRMRLKTDDGGADGGTTTMFSDTGYLEAGVWSHVAATYDGSKMRLYHNGVEIMSTDKTGVIQTDPNVAVAIGNSPLSDPGGLRATFNGLIDDVRVYSSALSEPEIRYLAGERPIPVDPSSKGLVVHYAFENDLTDSSGNGLDGTAVGDPVFVAGVEGMALDFNGDDYLDCGGAAEFSFTDAMTVSTWVNIRSVTTTWMAMIAKGENAWRLGVNGDTTGIHYAFTGGARDWQAANTATELPFGEWHQVTATYDTDVGATVYIDGAADASNPDLGGIVTNEFSLLIGDNPEATGRFFDGMLDEVKIYNRAVSEGEILYLAGFRENLLQNPSFEEDEAILDDPDWAQWVTWNPAEGAGSNATIVDTDAADGASSLYIEPIGVENWHFIVLYMPIPTEVGASYTTTFWAKAAEARPLGVQYKATDNSVQWGYADFELTTDWAEYSLTAEAENAETKLEFFCAGVEVPLWLDAISVYKE